MKTEEEIKDKLRKLKQYPKEYLSENGQGFVRALEWVLED